MRTIVNMNKDETGTGKGNRAGNEGSVGIAQQRIEQVNYLILRMKHAAQLKTMNRETAFNFESDAQQMLKNL